MDEHATEREDGGLMQVEIPMCPHCEVFVCPPGMGLCWGCLDKALGESPSQKGGKHRPSPP